mmetsp:Transcript_12007/g.25820  ORF Transcript_12007/g.25820 Transcript_12007/m.25820 type:complete len:80 (-) Transcript_12007:1907-2146(-)
MPPLIAINSALSPWHPYLLGDANHMSPPTMVPPQRSKPFPVTPGTHTLKNICSHSTCTTLPVTHLVVLELSQPGFRAST